MDLVHEDGSGKSDADSLCSIAFADSYHEKRGLIAWLDLDTAAKSAALIKATDYIESEYGSRFKGEIVSSTQSLCWPRSGAYIGGVSIASNIVPVPVQKACAELAWRATTDELSPDVGRTEVSVKVDSIQIDYDPSGPVKPNFNAVDALLSTLLTSVGGAAMVKLVRS